MPKKDKKFGYFFKRLPKKIAAFTLAELLLVFTIIGIVATAYTVDSHAKVQKMSNKLLSYNLYKSLDLAVKEAAKTNAGILSSDGPTMCKSLADLMNSVGEIHCDASSKSYGKNFSTPSFVLTNGMRFYNVATNPSAEMASAAAYITADQLGKIAKESKDKAELQAETDLQSEALAAQNAAEARYLANVDPNYNLTAEYNYKEVSSTYVSDDLGKYYRVIYNYTCSYTAEANGSFVGIEENAFNDGTCYSYYTTNVTPAFLAAGFVDCSTLTRNYKKTFIATSDNKYDTYLTKIKTYYDNLKKEAGQKAYDDVYNQAALTERTDKLYNQYYDEAYEVLYNQATASLPKIYNIYIDINGNRGKGILNDDVFRFTISTDGVILPAVDSLMANNINYMNAKMCTKDKVARATNITFRAAACRSGGVTDTTYCSGYTKDTTYCSAAGSCYYALNDPTSMWMMF